MSSTRVGPPSNNFAVRNSDEMPSGQSVPAAASSPPPSSEPRQSLPLYRRRAPIPGTLPLPLPHRNHKNISDASRNTVLAYDAQIQNAQGMQLWKHLSSLLDATFFQPVVDRRPDEDAEGWDQAFAIIESCPATADKSVRTEAAERFADAVVARAAATLGSDAATQRKAILEAAKKFLPTIRNMNAEFQRTVLEMAGVTEFGRGPDRARCSAQKMALETFAAAFPRVAEFNQNFAEQLLKKLIAKLPELEHSEIAERNAQRRGLHVLQTALKYMVPNRRASLLTELMNAVASLGTELSMRNVVAHIPKPLQPHGGAAAPLAACAATGGVLGVAVATTSASIAASALAPVVTPLPIAAAAGAFALYRYLGIRKQAQGTALYMLGDELAKLRGKWSELDQMTRDNLVAAYNNMHEHLDKFAAIKKSSLKRFFNDRSIDPTTFGTEPAPLTAVTKQIEHKLVAPLTSRLKSLPGRPTSSMENRLHAKSVAEEDLFRIIKHYFSEAKKLGVVNDAKIPSNFLENLRLCTKDISTNPDEPSPAQILADCFSRVSGKSVTWQWVGGIPEYQSPLTKRKILAQIIAMTREIATGDPKFVQNFVAAARIANENCHNNGRLVFRALWHSVIEKYSKEGKPGYRDDKDLLRIGAAFFRSEALRAATNEVLGKGVFTETGNAVEISLGKRCGILDPISGMSYGLEDSATPENFEKVFADFSKRISEPNALVDFLVQWAPLTSRIEAQPSYKAEFEKEIESLETAFTTANDAYFDTTKPRTDETIAAFNEASHNIQHRRVELAAELRKKYIQQLLDEHPGATKIETVHTIDIKDESVAADEGTYLPDTELKDESVTAGEGTYLPDIGIKDESAAALHSGAFVPDGIDAYSWMMFLEALSTSAPTRVAAAEIQPQAHEEMIDLLYAPQETSLTFTPDELPFPLVNNQGGGDCLFYALSDRPAPTNNPIAEASARAEARQIRKAVADVIAAQADTPGTMHLNAMEVAMALHQTPATRNFADSVIHGVHDVPNSVYAQLAEMSGIYAGEPELAAWSLLDAHRGKRILVVGSDGSLATFENGQRTPHPVTNANKAAVLEQELQNCDVALYKTADHWQRISKSKA